MNLIYNIGKASIHEIKGVNFNDSVCFHPNPYLILFFLAVTVTKRHWLLEESIGTMKMENEAFQTIWIVFSVTLTMFIVGPILLCSFFKKITTSFHLCHDIIAKEIEKEKAEEN